MVELVVEEPVCEGGLAAELPAQEDHLEVYSARHGRRISIYVALEENAFRHYFVPPSASTTPTNDTAVVAELETSKREEEGALFAESLGVCRRDDDCCLCERKTRVDWILDSTDGLECAGAGPTSPHHAHMPRSLDAVSALCSLLRSI